MGSRSPMSPVTAARTPRRPPRSSNNRSPRRNVAPSEQERNHGCDQDDQDTKTTKTTTTRKAPAKAKSTKRTAKAPPRLSDEQVSEVLALVKQAKTVELKLTVPEGSYRSTALALGLDPLDAQLRQVIFFDTPDLALNKAGVVVRARRSQGGPDDTVIKLRPVVPADLPEDLRALPDFGVEVDAMPGGFVCSASFKAKLSKNHVRATTLGERPISKTLLRRTTRVLRDSCANRSRARPALPPRSAQCAEAQVRAEGLRAEDGRRALVVPRRIAGPRTVDEVCAQRGVPGRRPRLGPS